VGDDFETTKLRSDKQWKQIILSMPFMWVMILKLPTVVDDESEGESAFNALYVGDDFETPLHKFCL